jgi:hypothetical protein
MRIRSGVRHFVAGTHELSHFLYEFVVFHKGEVGSTALTSRASQLAHLIERQIS